ncbi:MAG: T9SS type A sorting domain-containing protein [Ignavibacteriales bacterium]|nr:MAG: T9SS type A sorting domain-containing protein [Ignavibacteriaceae bacterium]MBW7872214.1 T9SS type A sorting domain-containing protein [Ignavibacteria bacterium]MCZ2144027.1 T9SS type A sorting domain-containing protein [Ignavibacteriales bacterium]MBV6445640.1 hypothetical protein [Ignavibacteriaceae bacterium]MBZ0196847.1 T9SS type A sorting domain-containing protein [Ignavibacteriaceae bacterium]
MNKLFTVVFSFLLLGALVTTQAEDIKKLPKAQKNNTKINTEDGTWTVQASGFATVSRGIRYMSVVDNNVVWASAYDGANTSNYISDFTRTTNGGAQWIAGVPAGTSGWGNAMIFAISATTAWMPLFNATAGGGKIIKTTDGGATWVHQSTATFTAPDGFANVVHFFDANNGFAMGDQTNGYFELYTTTNGGDNWVRVPQNNIPAVVANDEYGVVGYYDAVGSTAWFTTNKSRVLKTTDMGYTWTAYTTPVTSGNQNNIRMRDINNGIIFDGTNSGAPKLYRTTDGGVTWSPLLFSGAYYTNDYQYVPGTLNSWIATGAATGVSGCSYSNDDGATWVDFSSQIGLQMLAAGFFDNTTGWAGAFNSSPTEGGMYKFSGTVAPPIPVELSAFTASASQYGVNLVWETATEMNNYGFEVQRSYDNNVFSTLAFIKGNGTTTERQTYNYTDEISLTGTTYYRLRQIDMDGRATYSNTVEVSDIVPAAFELSQNYPNPFNPSTRIKFAIPQESQVELSVFDAAGRLVETLVSELKAPGYYEVVWNASNQASGIYFVTIKAGNQVQSIKMTLLK